MVTLEEQLAVEALGLDRFVSCLPPTRMGDLADWAYGGNILAIAISAAYATIKPCHHLYSLTGHFVRPASPSLQLICQVERIRDTRIFQTRHLRVYQESPTGEQLCLVATADFHIEETLEMVNYSTRPHSTHADAVPAAIARVPESGLYKYINRFMEVQPLPATDRKTEGDITGIISAERVRLQTPLGSESAQLAALAFYMDRGLAYIPANHAGRSLLDASACATLDFALRVMTHRVDVGEWMVSEQQTCAAGGARAVSEGRVFDDGGRLVAVMTQTTILRPKMGGKAKV
ncbi:thioesterase family protein [Aspergillus aculeatinus CBS 121060]|uniref:Thioesterase/thiol ester dehydrase-isomerase n=1 Tax=Aspergillus aculeatinus CBS 121060 TaxID=1448322 RepID=A0ACD1H2F5_9EURO|nr:Thioesterase/thiol ester dehydrase-isomerase [Aspergillus aculeatinus CBS 121060]RAH67578.1 Thioesterase/thiol ester dehydrase-isomerase [Aspergillus aculeatinus CBS 121060]